MLSDNAADQAAMTGKPSGRRSAGYGMDAGAGEDSPAAGGTSAAGRGNDSSDLSTQQLSVRPSEDEVDRRAAERDEAANAKPVLARVVQVLLAIFFPLLLVVAAIRAVTSPLFLWVEYHRSGFPSDSFGFSTEDRMTYGSYAMDYLLNFAGPRYLGDLVNDGGEPLFASDEVSHMADVKAVIGTTFLAAAVLALLAILAAVYLRRRYPGGLRRALFAGSAATLVLMVGVSVLGVLGWQQFFAGFHAIFFADGTWTFALDDTLIRLFPAQFWIDSAATVAALVLLAAVLTLVWTWPTAARRRRSAQAGSERAAAR